MKNNLITIAIGLVAGLLDLIPLIFGDAPLFNLLAIIAFWLCATLFIVKTKLIMNSTANGLLVALTLMVPMALTVAATNPKDFIPMMSMAIILGPLVGFSTGKLVK